MAGHRRNGDGKPTATLRASRPARRRRVMADRLAAAPTARARFHVAFDYLRGVVARRQPDPALTDRVLDDLTDRMIRAADDLLAVQARERTSLRRSA